jgi:mRNA interferase RelE/StbE
VSRWTVEFSTAAAKQVRKLDPATRRRVLAGLQVLADDPRGAGTKKLVGTDDGWGLRIGDYRVLYEVVDDRVVVVVFRAHRREVYRD